MTWDEMDVPVLALKVGDWLIGTEARIAAGPSSGIRTQPDETFVLIARLGDDGVKRLAPMGWQNTATVRIRRIRRPHA